MREYFTHHASTLGYEVIDMEPIFLKHFETFHSRFEFPHDNHWNSLGHELSFREIHNSDVFLGFLHKHQLLPFMLASRPDKAS